jgi:pyruvyl transferase EpsI
MVKIVERVKASKINRLIPYKWKMKLKYLFARNNRMTLSFQQALMIVAIAADYGNLGDVAITLAQMKFLKDHFPDFQVIPIYVKDLPVLIGISKSIKQNDIITIIGGGNMGDVYKGLENQRRYIINLFPKNKIISFPQTIDFKEEKSLKKSIKIYSEHPNLHIFARESQSYEIMKDSFRNNHVYLVPDIVLYLNKKEPKFTRDGITLCLRADIEKNITKYQQDCLIQFIKQRYNKVSFYDTVISPFTLEIANSEWEKLLAAFKQSKVVLTDRLHGMIFCAITNTPCVVLPNNNHKIIGTYHNWLESLHYITLVENFDEKRILEEINRLSKLEMDEQEINLDLHHKFDSLLASIKG